MFDNILGITMKETGIVVGKSKDFVDIQMQPSAACESCGVCFMDKNKLQVLRVREPLSVKPGDTVEVEITPAFAIKSAFLLFFFPLILLVVGYYFFSYQVDIPRLNAVHEGIVGAVVGIMLSYLILYLYDKHLQKKQPKKHVRVLTPDK
ncbi:MAG: hypothetical protein Kow0037_19230 [Calditrichia bacterium]